MSGLPVPDGLSDAFVKAYSQVVDERFAAIPVEACLVWDLRNTPELALLHIAEGLGLRRVLGAEPVRTGLLEGFALIGQRGTPAGLTRALEALDYTVTLVPHPEQLCDGSIYANGEPNRCGGDMHWAVCRVDLGASWELSTEDVARLWVACDYFGRKSTRYILVVTDSIGQYSFREKATAKALTITSPTAGEVFFVGHPTTVSGIANWTCDIEASFDPSFVGIRGTGTASGGTFAVDVTATDDDVGKTAVYVRPTGTSAVAVRACAVAPVLTMHTSGTNNTVSLTTKAPGEFRIYWGDDTYTDVASGTQTPNHTYSDGVAGHDVWFTSTALTELKCYSNQLTALDVTQCTALTELNCNLNQLTALDVTQCTALTDLYCYSNQLTALDVTQCTALTLLYCGLNQLTALDVTQCTALTQVKCYSNSWTQAVVDDVLVDLAANVAAYPRSGSLQIHGTNSAPSTDTGCPAYCDLVAAGWTCDITGSCSCG